MSLPKRCWRATASSRSPRRWPAAGGQRGRPAALSGRRALLPERVRRRQRLVGRPGGRLPRRRTRAAAEQRSSDAQRYVVGAEGRAAGWDFDLAAVYSANTQEHAYGGSWLTSAGSSRRCARADQPLGAVGARGPGAAGLDRVQRHAADGARVDLARQRGGLARDRAAAGRAAGARARRRGARERLSYDWDPAVLPAVSRRAATCAVQAGHAACMRCTPNWSCRSRAGSMRSSPCASTTTATSGRPPTRSSRCAGRPCRAAAARLMGHGLSRAAAVRTRRTARRDAARRRATGSGALPGDRDGGRLQRPRPGLCGRQSASAARDIEARSLASSGSRRAGCRWRRPLAHPAGGHHRAARPGGCAELPGQFRSHHPRPGRPGVPDLPGPIIGIDLSPINLGTTQRAGIDVTSRAAPPKAGAGCAPDCRAPTCRDTTRRSTA